MTEAALPQIFEDVSPEEFAQLAIGMMSLDESMSPDDSFTIGGLSTGSILAFAAARVAETVAQLISDGDTKITDDSDYGDILTLASAVGIASFMDGFGLANKITQMNEEVQND